MKLMVSGSRSIQDKGWVWNLLTHFWIRSPEKINVLIHGNAEGPDTFAKEWALQRKILHDPHHPNYAEHGVSAPHVRNTEMLRLLGPSDALICFWDGSSKGTLSVINKSKNMDLRWRIVKLHDIRKDW